MQIVFGKEYLRELYESGKCSDKKHRFQPIVIRKYAICIAYLERAKNIEDLFPINGLRYEVLKGDKKGISSVRINDQYRLEFAISEESQETVITICTILDISNHYK